MLDFIRRQSTSFLSWLILGGIALIFGLQFGLPSDSLTLGADSIAKVHGTEIRNEDHNFQTILVNRFGMLPKEAQMREMVGAKEEIVDGIVERLLLADEAHEMGLAMTQKEAEDLVLDGHAMVMGVRREWLDADEKYSPRLFDERILAPMRANDLRFLEHQSQELLAQALRDLLMASVLVPESEVRQDYEKNANTLSLRYARYEFSAFTDLVDPTPQQLDAYVADHAEALDKRYESQKTRFTELPPQARLGLVRVDATAEARTALEAARTEIAQGRQRFSAVARAQSTHDTASRGGAYGWIDEKSEAASDLPDPIRAAIPGLALDAVSEIIEADGGLWLLQVSERREGDVPKELALRELAEESVRDELAEDLARRAAEEDQNAVAAGTALNEVFAQQGALGETTLFGGTTIEQLPLDGETPAEGKSDPSQDPTTGDPVAGSSRPKAELRSTGAFVRGQRIPTLGNVPGLVDDAWTYAGDAELLDGIYEVAGAVILAGVESKQEATEEEYAEQRAEIYRRLQQLKANQLVRDWANRRCLDARAKGSIKVSEGAVKRLTTYDTPEEGDQAKAETPAKPPHSVCDRVGGGGGFLTSRYRGR
ncbi:MAG: SurA N-terminal domain-containing protein [Myxococcota bacterium]